MNCSRVWLSPTLTHELISEREGKEIFYDDADRRTFLDTLGEMGERFQTDIFDVDRFKTSGRLYGEDKAKRDMLVFMLWEGGAFTNAEIGEIFGVGYTAVSNIVNKVKGQLAADRGYSERYKRINSQIKM
jgi:hypothetical protein